jgi:hypothetical protein
MRIEATGPGDWPVSGRAKRLHRLLAIRMLTEDLDRSALQTALAAVAVVDAALVAVERAIDEARLAARVALTDGQSSEWMMADAQREVAGWDRSKLKTLLVARTELAGAAMKKFLESRREHEQVKQLVEDAEQAGRLEEARHAQAASDEWFLNKRTLEL